MNDVQRFERAFAEYVGAEYAIALCNGTATLHTAVAVRDPLYVAVPPLTMASTTIAVLLHAKYRDWGDLWCRPAFRDVDPDTWLMMPESGELSDALMPVSLYGMTWAGAAHDYIIVDAAQTVQEHDPIAGFTSYSFQASKILHLGEGGMLVTNDETLAVRAREFSSLGYRMGARDPVIDKAALKRPDHIRHHSLGYNYRMAESVARAGLRWLTGLEPAIEAPIERAKRERLEAASYYRAATANCSWIKPQHVPNGWRHDYWAYAVALEHKDLWHPFVDAIERHGGERPYAAWRITYQEPAFRHLAEDGTCPVAEDLQPRLVQFQTNDVQRARRNADAVDAAIYELNGVPA